MQPALILSDDPKEQIDQILNSLEPITSSLHPMDAVYVISALQLALSSPTMADPLSVPTQRVETFARKLSEGVKRHPKLSDVIEQGWGQTERAQAFHRQSKKAYELANQKAKEIELPDSIRGLKKLCSEAKVKGYSAMSKTEMVQALRSISPVKLVNAWHKVTHDAASRRAS